MAETTKIKPDVVIINWNHPSQSKKHRTCTRMHSNAISLSKLPALTGTNIGTHMITRRAAAVLRTVYHVDRVPDRLLMRFHKKMQFGGVTELVVVHSDPQKHGHS